MQLNKGEVIDIVWQYSKYYGNQLTFLEQLKSENAVVALIYLTNGRVKLEVRHKPPN